MPGLLQGLMRDLAPDGMPGAEGASGLHGARGRHMRRPLAGYEWSVRMRYTWPGALAHGDARDGVKLREPSTPAAPDISPAGPLTVAHHATRYYSTIPLNSVIVTPTLPTTTPVILLGFALAALIGLTLGLLGGGGSILTVPVLVYVLGFPAKTAIAMSLPVVGVTSLISAGFHWKLGNVRIQTAVMFGLVAMIGSFAGAKLSVFLSGGVQLTLLAVVMLGAAASMLRGNRLSENTDDADATSLRRRFATLAPAALAVGVLTGLVGIGGGFLVVPALVLLARVPMRQAVGTSLLVIAMNSASGFVGYLGTVQFDWGFLSVFTAIAVTGALVGTALASRVPQAALKRAFAVFLLVLAVFVLVKNLGAVRKSAVRQSAMRAIPDRVS